MTPACAPIGRIGCRSERQRAMRGRRRARGVGPARPYNGPAAKRLPPSFVPTPITGRGPRKRPGAQLLDLSKGKDNYRGPLLNGSGPAETILPVRPDMRMSARPSMRGLHTIKLANPVRAWFFATPGPARMSINRDQVCEETVPAGRCDELCAVPSGPLLMVRLVMRGQLQVTSGRPRDRICELRQQFPCTRRAYRAFPPNSAIDS